jgi:hypothetical protein
MKVRLINSNRETVIEFHRDDAKENGFDLVEFTNKFGGKSYYIFADKTEDGVLVYKAVNKVARVAQVPRAD